MDISRIITEKKTAGKATWLAYTFCSIIMAGMVYFSGWPTWILAELALHQVIVTPLTFWPKASVRLQSFFVTLFSFVNIFLCSVAEQDVYPALAVFLGSAIILAAYRSEVIMTAYFLLTVGTVVFHIAVLRTVSYDGSIRVMEFIVRVSVVLVAQFFLIILVGAINSNREAMFKSVKDARRAERYKSDFLANMSHEIRTPMNAIIGMCELILREKDLSESVRENCSNIQTSGKSLLAIINDILDFSKIESGKMEIICDEFSIASLINDVINMSEARKGEKAIEILVDVDPHIPRGLIGDEMRIKQIVVNLMTNAIKFTEKGSVTLTLSFTPHDYGGNLLISVEDTGIGITEENLEKLFTSFHQVDTKKNRLVEGTGLGLAISKRLIGYMGGFISVRSEYGVGTKFRFVIPMKVSDPKPFAMIKKREDLCVAACFGGNAYARKQEQIFLEAGEKLGADFIYAKNVSELKALVRDRKLTHIFVGIESYIVNKEYFNEISHNAQVFVSRDRAWDVRLPEGIKEIYKPFYLIPALSAVNNESMVLNLNERKNAGICFTAPKARILVVDDNAVNLKVVTGLLQPYNMQIVTARSGPEAIDLLRLQDIDIVFMDHMMPEMDGVEATDIIRKTEGEYYRRLPVIALTANVANGAREMFLESGFDDFLAKPIELSILDRILRNYLPREYMQPVAEASHANETG